VTPRLGLAITLIIACAAIMQACSRPLPPQASCNFVQNPDLQRVSWKTNLPIHFSLHESVPPEAYDAIDRAVAEYNLRLGGGREIFHIDKRDVPGSLDPQKDGVSLIYWFNTWDADKPTEQARTTIYWAGTEIFEADMRINAHNFTFNYGTETSFSNVDLDSLVLHELGHVLGLAHNATHGSVMNITLDNGQDRRKLGDPDMSSLKCEY
jgi:hypothetical protein